VPGSCCKKYVDVKNIEEMDAQYVSTKTITGKRDFLEV